MSKTRASAPCLSLWERWPSAARTERVYKTAIPSHTELHALQAIKIFFKDFNWSSVSVTFGDSSPRGRAKLTREMERTGIDTLHSLFLSIFPPCRGHQQDQHGEQLQPPEQHIRRQDDLRQRRKGREAARGADQPQGPGPMLFSVAITAVKVVTKSRLSSATSSTDTSVTRKYRVM